MQRLLAVQTQMRRREEWRLAALQRGDAALAERQGQLVTFLDSETGLSALMADSTARGLRAIAEQRAATARAIGTQSALVLTQQGRVICAERLCEELRAAAERVGEDADLAEILEADLAARRASLP